MGIPGPDAGNGGKHLLLPPDWQENVPDRYYAARSTTYRVIAGIRSIPVGGDLRQAIALIQAVKMRPLDAPAGWTEPSWLDPSGRPQDQTPVAWEANLDYWRAVHEVVDTEPPIDGWGVMYGELAALGIAKGTPFVPDERMTRILELAARTASAQMRVQAFADRRPDRVAWPDRQWGSGLPCGRTPSSLPTGTSMSMRAKSGSSRRSACHRP
jgi:hypothetical protein